MLLLVKLQVSTSNLTKSNTPPWMFFSFLNCTHGVKLRSVSNYSARFQPLAFANL